MTTSAAPIDLRSDTVTRPTAGMLAAMMAAEVGDDVYGDDPTVNRLQERVSEMVGMAAGIFMPSGTQSNLAALMTHCGRGDEYLVGQGAHTYRYEGGGAAVLGSIQPQPLENSPDGTIPLEKLRAAVKPDDSHFAKTRLVALENTISGKVLPQAYVAEVAEFALDEGLKMHLDGARLFNASVASGASPEALCAPFDSVSICLSKGLGTPVGSMLCGSRAFVEQAHRWRKMLGGGLRQAGILAAAGLYALDHHVERLVEDHANAARLADGLREIDELKIEGPFTNMVFVDFPTSDVVELGKRLREQGIVCSIGAHTRFVTHLDIDRAKVDRVVDGIKAFYTR
jgi:threonine aldolase